MVFIIDDKADYRFLLQQIFTRFMPQCPVRFFASGDALNQYVQTETDPTRSASLPSLILLDLNMPGLNGIQTLTMLKRSAEWKRIPVVMMSDAGSAPEQQQCYEAGANSFIAKPLEFTELKQVITTLCQYWLQLNQVPAQG